ncbi:MAG: type I-F CRISPR-associated protein Csy2 [bacterium]
MTELPHFDQILVIPRLRVQNANAISGSLTHGFPAISAFIGLMWALERKMHAAGMDLMLNAVGVVAHGYEELVTDDYYAKSFRLTRNPIGKDGSTAAIVEEGRMHMTISLVFALQSQSLNDHEQAQNTALQIKQLIEEMRIAGGTVLPQPGAQKRFTPYILPISSDGETRYEQFAKLKRHLLPGFALVERQDLLDQRFEEMRNQTPDCTRLDAWLSLSRFNWRWQTDGENPEKAGWQHDRKGWIVPIPLGYGALTELQAAGTVANARDMQTDFRFVESLYGIGQWISPHRLQEIQQLLWYAEYQPDNGVYRCKNGFVYSLTPEFDYD